MTKQKPLILITNDDGYFTKGIAALVNAAKKIGEVIVVAPNGPRSGMSSALSAVHPIRYSLDNEKDGVKTYICDGTPVDCIKLGLNVIVDRKPDLVLTGVNHGANSAVSVIYSGTMGAAIEGCLNNIPSVGFSLLDHSMEADFTESEKIIELVTKKVVENGLPNDICLNVNIPVGKTKGIKVGRQCKGKWIKEIMPAKDGGNNQVYWLSGNFESSEPKATDTDEFFLSKGYASIVPVKIDLTDYEYLKELKTWEVSF